MQILTKDTGILLPETEKRLDNIVQELFENDDEYQYNHTLSVVHWMKEMLKDASINEYLTKEDHTDVVDDHKLVLLSSAYLHDIGYGGLLKNSSYEERQSRKKDHMVKGAKLAYEITKELGFSNNNSEEISSLVRTHDLIDTLTTPNQIVLFEADCLGMIGYGMMLSNGSKFESTIRGEELQKFMDKYENRRTKLFKTEFGKRNVAEQLSQTKEYIKTHYS